MLQERPRILATRNWCGDCWTWLKENVSETNIDKLKAIQEKIALSANLTKFRLWTIVVTMFTGFHRFDEVVEILLEHIHFHEDHVKIIIPKSKGDIYRNGDEVIISRLDSRPLPHWSVTSI